jgi:hypothetical protein
MQNNFIIVLAFAAVFSCSVYSNADILASMEVSTIRTHPFLLITPADIERAKSRIAEPWAKEVIESLRKQSLALESESLPIFEKDWWDEASKKRWQDIYPEINYHTMFAVAGPIFKAADTAILYAVASDPKLADLVKNVLLHYTAYEFFAKHPDVGLNWSVWCLRALQAYDIIHDTVSETDRAKIDDFFRRAVGAVKANDEWWIRENPGGLYNNHFAWHKLFIGSYGLFYNKAELIEYALESDQGIRDLIENGSRDDGLWFESSLNYHFTAVDAIAAFAHELARAGYSLDLWNHRFANGRSLRDLLIGPIYTLFPDETLPTIGDTYGRRIKLDQVKWYWMAYDAYHMSEIAWLLRNVSKPPAETLFLDRLPESPRAPSMQTRIWPEHGYIALRTQEGDDYWRGEGYSVFLSYDSDGIHSHRDKFDLMIFGRGVHIAVDAEACSTAQHSFSSQIQSELNRTTLCHNTIMVDGKDHNLINSKLELEAFINNDDMKLATVSDNRGIVYPGVRLSRTVAVTGEYVLDIFQAVSNEEHTYDYVFHGYDDGGTFQVSGDFVPFELPNSAPWKWLRNARQLTIDENWHAVAQQGDVISRLTMLGSYGTRVITCEFPRKDNFEPPSIPMLIARRTGRSALFVAVIQAERGELPPVDIRLNECKHELLRIKVRCGEKERKFVVNRIR